MMAENYRNLRENDIYRQQTYAYRNQLDVIMESQGRIRALRHDMKNHILALQVLLQKKDWAEACRYVDSMQDFMVNPSEYIASGNESVDSLLNYKLQRANEILEMVEARISIPEKLMLHTFDLNVVLGNLLDNATEAASRTQEKRLRVMIKLEKGVLFINIRNSCQGIADGKQRGLETTKEDASNHGIGLGNVRRIVEKYQGEMDLLCKDGSMETDIIMYIKEM
jgi:sensor histidine kinase regulating citrate/malate metabolism